MENMEWLSTKDFGLTGLIILGIVYVVVTYIKEAKSKRHLDLGSSPLPATQDSERRHTSCADSLQGVLIENTRVTSELLLLMRQQSESDREWTRANQEAMQGLVIAINNVINTSREILDRVKDLDRR